MTDRLYLRISLDTLASGSIEKQRSQTRRHAHADDVVEYVDRSVSGSKIPFAERPAGGALMTDLRPGDRVLVTKIDRAARNVRDLLSIVERVERAGASIVFVEQNISTEGPMGRFMLTLLGAVAELEAAMIAERRRESLVAFRAEGRHAVGAAPFGLQSVPNPNGRGLVLRPHPEEAPALRAAVARILDGEVQGALAAELGIGAPGFSRLLRNERLAGILGHDADGLRTDPGMAVFSLVEWRRLQEHLDRPVKSWTKADGHGEILTCAVCGDRLYLNVAKHREHSTYRCRGVSHAPGDPGVAVTARNVDDLVEADFLATFGPLPMTEERIVSSSEVRARAVAEAELRFDAARRALDAAEEDEEETALRAYRAAKRALRDAEALPDETVTERHDTGETFAEVWQRSGSQDRTALLARAGRWVVAPGRLPLAEKVRREDAEPDYLAGEMLAD